MLTTWNTLILLNNICSLFFRSTLNFTKPTGIYIFYIKIFSDSWNKLPLLMFGFTICILDQRNPCISILTQRFEYFDRIDILFSGYYDSFYLLFLFNSIDLRKNWSITINQKFVFFIKMDSFELIFLGTFFIKYPQTDYLVG